MLAPWKKSYDQPRQHIKKQRHYFAHKGQFSQSLGFSNNHVWIWELDYKESWAPKNWCFWTVVLEKTFESSLDCKEIKAINPKGNQPGIFIRRTDAEASVWLPDGNSQLIGRDPDGWERLRARGEGGNRGWDGWMASLTHWTSSERWARTGKPSMLQSTGSQRVGHDWATEQPQLPYPFNVDGHLGCFMS